EQVKYLVGAGVHGAILVIERRWPAAVAPWGIHGISSRWRLLSLLAFMASPIAVLDGNYGQVDDLNQQFTLQNIWGSPV
ncbi:hypothetical protein, partial [Aeromonas bivalvium]|uniref:hypothetical protein n=1 Tax=Aeromonas bivalvium TaxID=440079 RepID=UPI003D1A1CDE